MKYRIYLFFIFVNFCISSVVPMASLVREGRKRPTPGFTTFRV